MIPMHRIGYHVARWTDILLSISCLDSLNLNTPVVLLSTTGYGETGYNISSEDDHRLHNINDAIAVVTSKQGLLPGVTFQAHVSQLAQLNNSHQTVSPCKLISDNFDGNINNTDFKRKKMFNFPLYLFCHALLCIHNNKHNRNLLQLLSSS